ncbi:hypothetical protein DFR72_1011216, partial [Lentzea flaviverrucosa]
PSLRYATAKVNKVSRGDGGGGGGFGGGGGQQSHGGAPADVPSGAASPAGPGDFGDEPPF